MGTAEGFRVCISLGIMKNNIFSLHLSSSIVLQVHFTAFPSVLFIEKAVNCCTYSESCDAEVFVGSVDEHFHKGEYDDLQGAHFGEHSTDGYYGTCRCEFPRYETVIRK